MILKKEFLIAVHGQKNLTEFILILRCFHGNVRMRSMDADIGTKREIFIIPIPPTSKETEAIEANKIANVCTVDFIFS